LVSIRMLQVTSMASTADSRNRMRNSRLGLVIGVVAVSYMVATVVFLVVY